MEVEWWMRSPSPMTLFFYSLLALYGAHRLESNGLKQWISNFGESAFLIGLIILPHDSSWQILQWFKWGYLHPTEWILVIGILIRNISLFLFCWLSSWKFASRTGMLKLRNMFLVAIPIMVLLIKFVWFTPEPVWSDWTYGVRFQENSPWLIAYLSGLPDKVSLGLVYIGLWR